MDHKISEKVRNTKTKGESMIPETIRLKVGYETEKIILSLRVISLEEEQEYTQRFVGMAETPDKHSKSHRIIVDALASWSSAAPIVIKGADEVTLHENDPVAGVKEYFENRTNEKERIAHYAMVVYRDKLTPSADFL